MAKWNSHNPLKIPKRSSGNSAYSLEFEVIKRGDQIPRKYMTPSFVGSYYNVLTALTQADMKKFEAWKQANPRIAHRWDYLSVNKTFSELHIENGSAAKEETEYVGADDSASLSLSN